MTSPGGEVGVPVEALASSFGDVPAAKSYAVHYVTNSESVSLVWTGFGFQSDRSGFEGSLPHSAAVETAGILASPGLVRDIAEGRDAAQRGEMISSDELDRLLANRE